MKRWVFFSIALGISAGSLGAPSASEVGIRGIFENLREKALRSSPELATAESELNRVGASLYTSATRWVPHVNLQLSQTRAKDYSFATNLGALGQTFVPEKMDLSRWALSASMPIYNRGVHLGLQTASRERDLARAQVTSKKAELNSKLRSVLGQYLLSDYRDLVIESTIQLAQTSLHEARTRFELGQKTRIDVLRAEANLASLQARQATLQQQLRSDKNTLLEFLGISESEYAALGLEALLKTENDAQVSLEHFADVEAGLAGVSEWIATDSAKRAERVVTSSPSYLILSADESLSKSRAQSLMAAEWPELLAQASLSKQATKFSDAFASGDRSYSVGLVLNIPLFSGGSFWSTHRESVAADETATIKRRRDESALLNLVEAQRLQLQALSKALQSTKLQVDQNEEIVRLSNKSYQLGRTSTLELLSAQNDLLNSKVDLADTKLKISVLARQFAWNLGVDLP